LRVDERDKEVGSNTHGRSPAVSPLPIHLREDPDGVVSSARELTAEGMTTATQTRWPHPQRPARVARLRAHEFVQW
jgi:hypothetical protein